MLMALIYIFIITDTLIRFHCFGVYISSAIIFCEANKEHLSHLSWVLFWFEAASGLKINLSKSEIIPVGEVDDIEELAAEVGCRVGSLPSQYLGLPLGAPNRASSMWDGVEERVRRRLALWKRQYISKGGRITLIKSTMASIPIYQMSLFRMPNIVVRRLEKLQRDFLWGGGNMERKAHLVKWEIVCGDKGRGGLGLRRLGLMNKALLGKWIWRYACERENLWKQVIWAKYGQEEYGWRSKKPNGAFGVGVWKEIMKENEWCWDSLELRVGKGNKIRFWTDVWCAGTALSQSFPHLFALAVDRNATVEEMWDQNSDQGGWNLRFLRNFNDWEVGMVGDLLLKLRGLRPALEEDSISWKGGKSGRYKVKMAYSGLVNPSDIVFPEKSIWVNSVPTKVAFFAWEASWEKVLTLDRLQRRGWHLPNCCFLCGCAEESVNHILIHCIVVRALWELVLGLVGVKWVFPETVKERKSNEAETESLREEYHQRVAALERKGSNIDMISGGVFSALFASVCFSCEGPFGSKADNIYRVESGSLQMVSEPIPDLGVEVYALTKERDTLRREHSRKSDAAALLKEKDEIINQVMAEDVGVNWNCNKVDEMHGGMVLVQLACGQVAHLINHCYYNEMKLRRGISLQKSELICKVGKLSFTYLVCNFMLLDEILARLLYWEIPLKRPFLSSFALLLIEVKEQEMFRWGRGSQEHRIPCFKRAVHDWEIEKVGAF
ncbi:putative ribonuclease H protein [Vitis vinifera]|uniref:Putative ribonuclease H protein n=1 Tax=Vitis vinifera TaxID=29760 RepID=A0A438E0Q5_VITVI|nr:putative ribonuclease H protein [Vitis vinifera]